MKKFNSVLSSSRRILIAVLFGIVGALTLPDIRLRPPPAPYVREAVHPTHRDVVIPIIDLWNESPDGFAFCRMVKSLKGCWDVSENFIPGNLISGLVRTESGQTLLVAILPPYPEGHAVEGVHPDEEVPAIIYHVPQTSGAFLVDQQGNIRSVEKNAGFRMQSLFLKQLAEKRESEK